MNKTSVPSESTLKLWMMKIHKTAASLGSSFWFLPTLFISLALLLAVFVLPLYAASPLFTRYLNELGINNPNTAMQLVQVIASSLITVTSIAFSMTLVALVMASNSFGPRLIRSFMQSKKTQFVLGFFSASFVYCLIVISQLRPNNESFTLPLVSVFVALVLAVFCVFLLIFFIHHVAVSIRADTVVDEISRSLLSDMKRLQNTQGNRVVSQAGLISSEQYHHKSIIRAKIAGYIQAIEYDKLAELAKSYNGLIEMKMRAGKYIYPDTELACLYANQVLADDICIDEVIITGSQRTPLQDPQYAINQLVEMALRALSPSMNDPFTAITCIDKLIAALASFNEGNLPKTLVLDSEKTARVLTNEESFDELFSGAFNQIRQASDSQCTVLCHLLDVFYNLLVAKQNARHLIEPISTQVAAIEQIVEQKVVVKNDIDQAAILERVACILDCLKK